MSQDIESYIGYIKRGFTTNDVKLLSDIDISGNVIIDGDLMINSNIPVISKWILIDNEIYNYNSNSIGIGTETTIVDASNANIKLDVSGETRIRTNDRL